ncbi:unnamed protein product, partial [Durusdinium trenchii]
MPPKRTAGSDEVESMTLAQLKEKAKELGVVTSGTKQDLITRIKACDKKRPAPKAAAEPAAKRGKVESSPKAKAKGRSKPQEEEPEEEEKPQPRGKAKAKAKSRAKEEPASPKAKAKGKAKAQDEAEAIEGPALEEVKPAEGQVFWEEGEFCTERARTARSTCKICQ